MSEQLDNIIQQMAEVTTLLKEHKHDPATIDFETVKGQFSEQIEALVAAQVKEKMDAQPQRRVPGAVVWAEDKAVSGTNRYRKIVKDIGADGAHRDFVGNRVKAVDAFLAYTLLAKGHALMPDRVKPPSEDLREALKALTAGGTGTGDELVPTEMAAELWQDFFLASRVVGNMVRIAMPTDPFDQPLGLGDVTWRKGVENTATTASDPATAKSTLTSTEQIAEVNWSYTLDEDAVLAVMPAVRERLGISGAEQMDAFALSADSTDEDTGNINLHDANPAATAWYLSAGQDGIRHAWLVDKSSQTVNAGGDALGDPDVLAALVLMGKYAANPDACRMVCDVSTYLKGMLNLDGVQTLDKFGPNAVIMTGQLASYRGIPVIVSASHPLAEADGCVSTTANLNTLGSLSIFNRLMWTIGFRRELLIEVDRDIQKRMNILVVSFRIAVAAHGARASITHAAGIRNILVA